MSYTHRRGASSRRYSAILGHFIEVFDILHAHKVIRVASSGYTKQSIVLKSIAEMLFLMVYLPAMQLTRKPVLFILHIS